MNEILKITFIFYKDKNNDDSVSIIANVDWRNNKECVIAAKEWAEDSLLDLDGESIHDRVGHSNKTAIIRYIDVKCTPKSLRIWKITEKFNKIDVRIPHGLHLKPISSDVFVLNHSMRRISKRDGISLSIRIPFINEDDFDYQMESIENYLDNIEANPMTASNINSTLNEEISGSATEAQRNIQMLKSINFIQDGKYVIYKDCVLLREPFCWAHGDYIINRTWSPGADRISRIGFNESLSLWDSYYRSIKELGVN